METGRAYAFGEIDSLEACHIHCLGIVRALEALERITAARPRGGAQKLKDFLVRLATEVTCVERLLSQQVVKEDSTTRVDSLFAEVAVAEECRLGTISGASVHTSVLSYAEDLLMRALGISPKLFGVEVRDIGALALDPRATQPKPAKIRAAAKELAATHEGGPAFWRDVLSRLERARAGARRVAETRKEMLSETRATLRSREELGLADDEIVQKEITNPKFEFYVPGSTLARYPKSLRKDRKIDGSWVWDRSGYIKEYWRRQALRKPHSPAKRRRT